MHQRWLLQLADRALHGDSGAIAQLVLFFACVGIAVVVFKWWLDK